MAPVRRHSLGCRAPGGTHAQQAAGFGTLSSHHARGGCSLRGPQGRGCEARLRDSRGRQPSDLRRALRRRHRAHPGPPRAGRRARRRGLREGVRPGRGGARHLRAGGDEPGHRDRGRPSRLGADGLHHRSGPHGPDRHRRLPGGRRHRDHAAGRQALVPGPGPAPDPRVHPPGLPRRLDGPAGSGPGRRAAGPLARRHRLRAGDRHARPPRLPAEHRGQHQADPPRREGARQRRPPDHLRGRRGDQRERLRGASRAGHRRQLPRHLHGDGPRRVPGTARAMAGDARHARHPGGELGAWTRPT